jgi:hypothetical protein
MTPKHKTAYAGLNNRLFTMSLPPFELKAEDRIQKSGVRRKENQKKSGCGLFF